MGGLLACLGLPWIFFSPWQPTTSIHQLSKLSIKVLKNLLLDAGLPMNFSIWSSQMGKLGASHSRNVGHGEEPKILVVFFCRFPQKKNILQGFFSKDSVLPGGLYVTWMALTTIGCGELPWNMHDSALLPYIMFIDVVGKIWGLMSKHSTLVKVYEPLCHFPYVDNKLWDLSLIIISYRSL